MMFKQTMIEQPNKKDFLIFLTGITLFLLIIAGISVSLAVAVKIGFTILGWL